MFRRLASLALLQRVAELVILLPLVCGRGELGFSIDEGKAKSGTDLMQLSTVVSLPASSTSISVCCHFKLLFMRGDYGILVTLNSAGSLSIGRLGQLYILEDFAKSYTVKNYTAPVRQWVHVCMSVYGGVRAFINGQRKEIAKVSEISSPVLKTGDQRLMIGKIFEYPDTVDAEITFWTSIPVVVPWKVSQEEVDQLSQCGSDLEGNLVTNSWEELVFLRSINVIVRRDVPTSVTTARSAPCWTAYNSSYTLPGDGLLPPPAADVVTISPCTVESDLLLLATGAFDFDQAHDWCRLFNGSLPAPRHPTFDQTIEQIYNAQNEATFWKNNRFENNTCLVSSRNSAESIQFYMDCSIPVARHLICEIPPSTTFYALGNEVQRFSPLYLDKCNGVSSCFYTKYRDKISLSDDGATYQFRKYNQKILLTAPTMQLSVPVGKFIAYMKDSDEATEVAISSCMEDEFTCNDGSCLPLAQHCDGVGQCEVYEDESCPQNVLLSSNYDSSRPPRLGFPVQLLVRIGKISDVDISNGRIKMQMELLTSWDDDRLSFIQLENELKKNEISEEIWYPKYQFEPLVFKDEMEYFNGNKTISAFYAQRGAAGNLTSLRAQRKRLFEARVIHLEQVSFTFLCDFDLMIYPFGTYPCQFNISMSGASVTGPHFDFNSTKVELPSQSLPLFVARYSAFAAPGNTSDAPRTITVTVLLESRFGGFILSIFMPCSVITSIGISTLFFAFDNFQDRITVTLSCLIVEAGLYSQVTDVVPISAAPKLIDIFFFYAITRLFFMCMNHVFTYRFLIWLNCRKAKTTLNRSQLQLDALTTSGARTPVRPPRSVSTSAEVFKGAKTTNHEPNSKLCFLPSGPKTSMVEWENNIVDEKKQQNWYRRFKHIYYASIVIGFAFDTLGFAGSCFLIYRNWSVVFEEYPSLTQTL